MKHLLNICNINGAEIEPVDVITFGSPCQDMSVAGKREGIKHSDQGDEETTRSGLFYEAVRIIKEMRKATNGEYPKYAVWENVCFAAGTLVTCEGGYKPIERVFVGEKVKTLSGKYLPVVRVHKTKRQNVLKMIATSYLPVLCFGLKTDFQTHLFEGSKRLFELADSISEIKSICRCGNKAEINSRIINGNVVYDGEQILIGGNDEYEAMCFKCWSENNFTKVVDRPMDV